MDSVIKALEEQLKKDKEELDWAENIAEITLPVINKIERGDILNPLVLKSKLAKLPPEYRDSIYGLCRITTDSGPEGSIIVLDPKKVLEIIDEIEVEEKYQSDVDRSKNGKKFILGFTKKIATAIKGLIAGKLAVLCHLVNSLIVQKIINTPAADRIKTVGVKVKSLVSGSKKGKSK